MLKELSVGNCMHWPLLIHICNMVGLSRLQLSMITFNEGFYGAVRKLTFLKKLFCLSNSITVDVMSTSVLLIDHFKTKLYLITNKSSYKILWGISILVHKWESMFNLDLIRDTIARSKDMMTHLMGKCAIHHIVWRDMD
jgi:hypothetical protein